MINTNFDKGIVVIGAGNVATHLSMALNSNKFNITCVYSRTEDAAKLLADKVDANHTNKLEEIPTNAGLYIISVKDEVKAEIVSKLEIDKGIVVHTAGSVGLDIFEDSFSKYGVFYPLQTFTKQRAIDFSVIPICVEASSLEVENKLLQLARCLSKSVHKVSSEERKILHLSAVFACNFANHMYSLATNILEGSNFSFDMLKPLIEETAKKAIDCDPIHAQTGPAVRNDQNVIKKHLDLLKDNNEYDKIYRFVSESIYNLKKKKSNNG